jgi:hypothetical protein
MGRWSLALLAGCIGGCGLTGKENIQVKVGLSGGGNNAPATATPAATATPDEGASGAAELFPFALLTIVEGGETKNCMAGFYGEVLVTAGHCLGRLAEQACNDGTLKVRWFGTEEGVPAKPASVAICSSFVVAAATDSKNDFALIRLAPNSTRPSFTLTFAEQDPTSGTVRIYGPPGSEGKIQTSKGTVYTTGEHLFTHNAGNAGGASGSPVLPWTVATTDEPVATTLASALKQGAVGMHVGLVSGLVSAIPASRLKAWVESNSRDSSKK